MASRPHAIAGEVQMITRDSMFSEIKPFVKEFEKYSTTTTPYTVVSIIGRQSSGKSYLLNYLFGTKFDVLNTKASGKRQRTTEGIWVARCINPCMIIMDVEGLDGMQNANKEFERRSALFSLAVSDVLLLNIWYNDIGTENGACTNIIELLFQEIVKIKDKSKMTLIIVVRDQDYEEDPAITRSSLHSTMEELWSRVHPPHSTNNGKMSDYFEITVQDLPQKLKRDQQFAQEAIDLKNLLHQFASNGSNKPHHCPFIFDVYAKGRWDDVCSNKIISADPKMAMSQYVCNMIKDEIISSMENEQEYISLISGGRSRTLDGFNAQVLLLIENKLAIFQWKTGAFDKNIAAMKKLDKKIAKMFLPKFTKMLEDLSGETISTAKSNVYDELDNFRVVDENAVSAVIRSYLVPFHVGDVHDVFKDLLERHRDQCEVEVSKVAKLKAIHVKINRGLIKGAAISAKVLLHAATGDPSGLAGDVAEIVGALFD